MAILFVGGALTAATCKRNPAASPAAAKWQLQAAVALAGELRVHVRCLSYLPTGIESSSEPDASDRGVIIRHIQRRPGLRGALRYAKVMLDAILSAPRSELVFCYNPLLWTAPWAWLAAARSRCSVVMIVADLESGSRHWASPRYCLERLLLLSAREFLLLSEGSASVLRASDKYEVFNGLADPDALAWPAPTYGDGPLRFVYAGTQSADCGYDDFVEAAELMSESCDICEFHVFGRNRADAPQSKAIISHGFVSDDSLNAFLAYNCVGVNPRRATAHASANNAPYKLLYYLSRGVLTLTTRTAGVPPDLLDGCIVIDETSVGLVNAFTTILKTPRQTLLTKAEIGRQVVAQRRSSRQLLAALACASRDFSNLANQRVARGY